MKLIDKISSSIISAMKEKNVDELEKSVKDLTSLSQSLRDVFTKINRETDVLGNNFKNNKHNLFIPYLSISSLSLH